MGILANTVSICHFRVEGQMPLDLTTTSAENLARMAFSPIDESLDELSIGWVHLDDSKLHTFASPADFQRDGYIVFSMRRDQRKVPAALLKEYTEKAYAQFLADNPTYTRVPKLKKEELKEQTRVALLAKTLPTPQTYDLVWDTKRNLATFTTLSSKTIEIMQDLFKRTFEGLRLVQYIPYHRAMDTVHIGVRPYLMAANRATSENFLELLGANEWIGTDFLSWLLYCTMNRSSEYKMNRPGYFEMGADYVAYINDKLTLAGEGEGGTQTITVNGPQTSFNEVRSALQAGKRIYEATIHLETGDEKWALTLNGRLFHFAGYSCPDVRIEKDNTVDELMEREAVFFERMNLMDKGLQLFHSLFAEFLCDRLDSGWSEVSADIQRWIQGEEAGE